MFESTPYFASISPMDVQVTIPLPTTVESFVVEGVSRASMAPTRPLQVYPCCLRVQVDPKTKPSRPMWVGLGWIFCIMG